MDGYKITGLQGLSIETIDKAFKKVKTENLPEEWELKLLTKDMKDAAVFFMREYFVPYERLVQLFDVQWDEDAAHYWEAIFDQGITLVLMNKIKNEIIALRGIEIIRKSDRVNTESIADERLHNLLDFLNYCDDHAKFFEHYKTEEAVHFTGLAVSESYRRRGIATLLMEKAVDFIKNLGLDCVYIKGEASSDYSKKIYEKLEFETLFEQIYIDYAINGQQAFNEIGEHTSNKCYGKCITK